MRKFMLIAVVVLSAMLCFTGCFKKKEESGLKYVPKSASVAGSVDVAQLLSIQKVKESIIEKESDPKTVELKKAGLSAEKVKSVSFGVDLSAAADGKQPEGVMIIQLTGPVTDEKKVIELLKKEMGEEAQAQFLSNDLLAIGTPGMVGEAVKLKGGTGDAVTANADLMAVSDKGSKTGLLWIAALVPKEQLKKFGEKAAGAPVSPESVKDVFLSGDYSDAAGLSIDIIATFNSKDEAIKVVPTLEQMKGMASMFSGGKITGEMIKVEQKEAQISLSVKIPKAVLDALLDQATKAAEKTVAPPALESTVPTQ